MSSGSLNDTAAALVKAFSLPEIDQSQSTELRQALSAYVDKHSKGDEHASARLQEELRNIYRDYVQPQPKKLGSFVTVLKILRPSIIAVKDIAEWLYSAIRTFVEQTDATRSSIEDARDFVVSAMLYDQEAPDAREKGRMVGLLTHKLLEEYISRTQISEVRVEGSSLRSQNQAQQQLQGMLLAFGRQQPKDLFNAVDTYLIKPETRFQVLHLLSAWLQLQQAHLYLVVHTPVVEHLLKCLMNDRSTAVVSVALQCLVMLLPHIPVTVSSQLPRLFLIYSRCLCWEKFSSSSSKAQKDHVTDDRVRRSSNSSDDEFFSVDPSWKVLHSVPVWSDRTAPELLSYFTYLYGLYPLNFTSYIRKPRKYLKNASFPGADDFDLDQAVIRSRTEQYQRAHLLHPNFFNTTIEDELADNRWLKAEPSEVVAECLALYAGTQTFPGIPGPPPSEKLPALPEMAPLEELTQATQTRSGTASPTGSAPSVASSAWQNISTRLPTSATGSPVLHPVDKELRNKSSSGTMEGSSSIATNDFSRPATGVSTSGSASDDAAYLQRELMLIRNELSFERYLKQQHIAAIGQLKRDRIKAVTMEAETATLINANRALQKKLGDANRFNEKMQKETQARKTHSRQSEDQLTSKIRALRAGLTDQEALRAKLDKVADDAKQLRQLLVESESREFRMKQEVESWGEKGNEHKELRSEIETLKHKLQTYKDGEQRTNDAAAERDTLKQEVDTLQVMVANREQEGESSKKALQTRIDELEKQLASDTTTTEDKGVAATEPEMADLQSRLERAQAKQTSMKRSYVKVVHELTEMKIKYEDLLASTIGGLHSDVITQPMRAPPRQASSSSPSYDTIRNQGQMQQLYHGPPVGQTFRQQQSSSPQHNGLSITTSAPQSFPANRPVRNEVYEQRQREMNSSPLLSRSEGAVASFHDSPHMHHGNSNGSWSGDRYRSPSGPDSPNGFPSGRASQEFIIGGERSGFDFDSDDDGTGSLRSKDSKVLAKSEKRVYGRGGAQNVKMKNSDKVDKFDKPPKSTTGFRGLKGIL